MSRPKIIAILFIAFISATGCVRQEADGGRTVTVTPLLAQGGDLPDLGLPSFLEIRWGVPAMKSIVSSLKSRRKKPLSVTEFLKISAAIQKIETHTGVIGSIYQEMRNVGAIYIQPGRWVRIPLQSFCLNSGRASPRENEAYILAAVPAREGQWLPLLMKFNRLQKANQGHIQSIVWRMKSGASYRDLNKSDQAIIKEAIPDADKPFSSLTTFFKTLPGRWKDTFQDTGRIASELSQRQSNEPMKEPATRWMQLDDGLAVRVDRLMGYGTTYVTIANINNSGLPVEFVPADYILEPSRKSVQELSLSPAWADKWWEELARLIDEAYQLMAEAGVVFVPGVNDFVDLYEFLSGSDFLSGKPLSLDDRALAALGLVVGSGRGYRKGADEVGMLAKEATSTGADAALDTARRYLGKADEELLDRWSRATYGNRQKSIIAHWEKHAKPFGKSIEEYTKDADEFFKGNTEWKKVVLKDGTDGLKFQKKGGPGGYFTVDGKIVTFWYK